MLGICWILELYCFVGIYSKAMTGHTLSKFETNALESAEKYLSDQGVISTSDIYPS
jgi:hypothetical protein